MAVSKKEVSPVQKELAKVLGDDMPDGDPNEQKFLKAVLNATLDEELVSGDQWEALSEQTQHWANDAAEAVKTKKPVPPFPGGTNAEVEDEQIDESEETVQAVKPEKAAKSKKAAKVVEVVEVEAAETTDEEDSEDEQDEQDDIEIETLQPAEEAAFVVEDGAEISEGTVKETEVTTKATKKSKATKAKPGRPKKGTAEAPTKAAKPAKPAKKSKPEANGNGSVKGIDAVFKIIARDLKASRDTVANKLETQGVEVPKNRLDDLYRKAHKMVDALITAGKMS